MTPIIVTPAGTACPVTPAPDTPHADAALAEMGAVRVSEPAPVSVREAARVLLDWTDHNVNGAGQDFADDIGTGGIAALRAIAGGKE